LVGFTKAKFNFEKTGWPIPNFLLAIWKILRSFAPAHQIFQHMKIQQIDHKLAELGLHLPVLPTSKGIYQRCLTIGNLVYFSGHVSVNTDGSFITGKLGADLNEEQGKAAARQCGLAILAALKEHLGSLDKVKRVVKLLGMVNATPDYQHHPVVINGCSELFASLWGPEHGVGVRSAVGMGSLPGNVAVEIEGIVEVGDS
jgi:enamine deaminase RidA (YjgF/YER057c/UK114 family)